MARTRRPNGPSLRSSPPYSNWNLFHHMANSNIAISDPVMSILRNCADIKMLPVTQAWPAACSAEVVRPSHFRILQHVSTSRITAAKETNKRRRRKEKGQRTMRYWLDSGLPQPSLSYSGPLHWAIAGRALLATFAFTLGTGLDMTDLQHIPSYISSSDSCMR